MTFPLWVLIGALVVIFLKIIRKPNKEMLELRKRVKEAYNDDTLYWCVYVMAGIGWFIFFILIWPITLLAHFLVKSE